MELHVGGRDFDLRSRALVVGRLEPLISAGPTAALAAAAASLVAAGADLLELCVAPDAGPEPVCEAVGVLIADGAAPLVCATTSESLAGLAVRAGAAMIRVPFGLVDSALAKTAAAAGATVIVDVGGELARVPAAVARAAAAGVARDRLVAAVGAARGLDWREATAAGVSVLASLSPALGMGETVGLAVAAMAGGCRLLDGAHVRTLRRTANSCAELLEAR